MSGGPGGIVAQSAVQGGAAYRIVTVPRTVDLDRYDVFVGMQGAPGLSASSQPGGQGGTNPLGIGSGGSGGVSRAMRMRLMSQDQRAPTVG